jgi:hypothetical protein
LIRFLVQTLDLEADTQYDQYQRRSSMRRGYFIGVLALAIVLGLLITWVDTRPGWDDTGITAGMLLLTAALFGALDPTRPWLWALAIGAWIPLVGVIQNHNFGSLLALAFALLGAYGGALLRKAFTFQHGSR